MISPSLKNYFYIISNQKRITSGFIIFLSLFLPSIEVNATVENGRWHANIADPTFLGWLTVIAYIAAAICCGVKAKYSKQYGGNYRFWIGLACLLLLLGINKQLNLQSLFGQIFHDSAVVNSWFERSESIKIAFFALLSMLVFFGSIGFRLYLANSWRNYKIAWIGLLLLGSFFMLQAANTNKIQDFFEKTIAGIGIDHMLEIAAITLIALGTYFNKKTINTLAGTITVSIKDYVEISKESDVVQCPQCGIQPLSKPKDGRVFKCRSCGYHYSVRIINR
jgi:predicted RNA-binding Zn-ribbon protein involved in translation (DUF1610 family)